MTSTSSLPDETVRDAIAKAYIAGATDVHIYWRAGGSDNEPDFAEAASDYAADKLEALAGRVAMLTEALEEMLDTFDGQPMPCEAQEDRQERAVWFAVCALRCVNGEAYNCEGGDAEAALAAARCSVTEFRAALAQTQSEG